MSPNKFVLKGSGVEVDYTIGITPGFPSLVYRDGVFEKVFASTQIQSNDTGLGELVSVPLILSVDTGGQRFGFFLPLVDIATRDQTVQFRTVGIYETFSGPDSIPRRPSTWRCIEMKGIAQNVIMEV
ncbi:hypothetical protein [Paraburkholderia sp. HD33-4]|uniref:hypothetical protein n=1 Tax=Paraburkholderia sp. HD33-4 TaxID=2883242 RepID=UPI001F492B2B|nr:hypothetical protein [Paraburkholderia sp. HD33-4]